MTAPGWFPNPDGTPSQRFWDGRGWTDQVHPNAIQSPAGYAMPVQMIVPSNGLATASLVLGLIGAIIEWGGLLTLTAGVLAIIFGAIGIGRSHQFGHGHGRAVAGLVLGIIAIVAYLFWGLVTLGVFFLI
jgi:hypothetical protein